MAGVPIVTVLAALAVFGIHTSSACSATDIQKCVAGLSSTATMNTQDLGAVCRIVKDATDCIEREMSTCPSSMQPTVDAARQAINMVGKACDDPNSFDSSNMESCDANKLNRCLETVKSGGDDAKEQCLKIGGARRCIADFQKTCKSDFMNQMIGTQESSLDSVAQMCEERGYPTESGGSKIQGSGMVLLTSAFMLVLYNIL